MSVSPIEIQIRAKNLAKELMLFALYKSTDPEKQRALERLQELRLEIQEILDKIAPGWEE